MNEEGRVPFVSIRNREIKNKKENLESKRFVEEAKTTKTKGVKNESREVRDNPTLVGALLIWFRWHLGLWRTHITIAIL